jgi:hypothetical protein
MRWKSQCNTEEAADSLKRKPELIFYQTFTLPSIFFVFPNKPNHKPLRDCSSDYCIVVNFREIGLSVFLQPF